MFYAFGLGFGLVAFAIPARNSIVQMIVMKKNLQAGNSLIMGISKLAGIAGLYKSTQLIKESFVQNLYPSGFV